VEGRPLVLGGVAIPFEKGPRSHSDGDVLLHALTDALLGACGQGDIGELFPDSDPAWKDAASAVFVAEACRRLHSRGYVCMNADCVIHAERPKLSAYKATIAENVARLLGIPADRVSVKAKTGEGLGAIGCGDAIAANVVVLIRRSVTAQQVERP
jgi:2-C-methyl-D-erythritol 2,4-cyclodiphosphate synthase